MIEFLVAHPPQARDLVARVADVLEAHGADLLAPETPQQPRKKAADEPGAAR